MPLASVEETTAFGAGKDVAVIGVFADQTKDAAKAYLAPAAANIDYIPFAITSSAEVAAEHKIEGEAVRLLKTFDDGRAVLASDWRSLSNNLVFFYVACDSYLPAVMQNQVSVDSARARGSKYGATLRPAFNSSTAS